jgi:hypothetical protein
VEIGLQVVSTNRFEVERDLLELLCKSYSYKYCTVPIVGVDVTAIFSWDAGIDNYPQRERDKMLWILIKLFFAST